LLKQTELKRKYCHTIVCGEEENPNKLLLITGYGEGAAMYYKIMKPLCKYFQIFAIDMIGMGGSYRA